MPKSEFFECAFGPPFPPTLFPSFFPPLSPSGPVHFPTTSPLFTSPIYPLIFDSPENSDLGTPLIYVLFSVLPETHWALSSKLGEFRAKKTRWVRFGTQIICWVELTELASQNSVSPEELTEFGVWNRAPLETVWFLLGPRCIQLAGFFW